MRGHFIYLPPILSHSTPQTAHSAVVRLSFPVQENHSLFFFFLLSDYQPPEACHQHSFENDFTGLCAHALHLFDFPKSQALSPSLFFVFVTVLLLVLSFTPCLCDHPTQGATLFAQRLFDLSFPGGFFLVVYLT